MKTFLKALVLSVLMLYWSITFIFTLPDNYINISLYKCSQLFSLFLFQRWSFFAPPPTFNERLYYSYVNRNDSTIKTYEVLQIINEKKSENAPFNWNHDIIDYILSNSVVGVSEIIFEAQQSRRAEDNANVSDSVFQALLNAEIYQSSQFITLKNYGKIIAEKNNIELLQHDFIVTLTRIQLPKFADRYDNIKKSESLFFRSKLMDLNF
jgi:hypothetical protein